MRAAAVAAWAAGLIGLSLLPSAASAQSVESRRDASAVDMPAPAASPYNARYIPGVGFRYTYPGGPQVYGYVRYARGYMAKRPGVYRNRYYRDRRWWW